MNGGVTNRQETLERLRVPLASRPIEDPVTQLQRPDLESGGMGSEDPH